MNAAVSGPPRTSALSPHLLGRAETWAAAAPLLCAAHCIAAPLLVALAPRLALAEAHERTLMGAALVLAAFTTLLGVRVHRRASPLLLVFAGALLWLGASAVPVPEEAATVAASLLMAGGTLWSARLRHLVSCPRCACPASAAGDGSRARLAESRTRGSEAPVPAALPSTRTD